MMSTRCKIFVYNMTAENFSFEAVQRDIEDKDRKGLAADYKIKTISTAIKGDYYIVNVVYEVNSNLLVILTFIIIILAIILYLRNL